MLTPDPIGVVYNQNNNNKQTNMKDDDEKTQQCFYLFLLELFIMKTITTTKTYMKENA